MNVLSAVVVYHDDQVKKLVEHINRYGEYPKDTVELTEDFKPMVNGELVFKLIDSHGLPLEVILDRLYPAGMAISWGRFVHAASKANWSNEQIYKKILYGIQESMLDRNMADSFTAELNKFFGKDSGGNPDKQDC